jgi:hypothetical protein
VLAVGIVGAVETLFSHAITFKTYVEAVVIPCGQITIG